MGGFCLSIFLKIFYFVDSLYCKHFPSYKQLKIKSFSRKKTQIIENHIIYLNLIFEIQNEIYLLLQNIFKK